MKLFSNPNGRKTKRAAAFTVAEVVVAIGLFGVFVVAGLSSIVLDQISNRKAKQEAIAMNFLTKYVENIKALPFASVEPGFPINSIYNGVGGAPLIVIPTNNSPVSLNTLNFQTFYPDLLWLTNLNPTMTVNLTQNSVGGVAHDTELNIKVDWNAPLARGGQLEVEVDVLRTANTPNL